jgi:glycosyltransferase involved in cell wall biosynthesis
MKIVHLLPGLTKGGGEKVTVDLANHAAAAGHQVTVIAGFTHDPAVLRETIHPAVDVRYISTKGERRLRLYGMGFRWFWQNRFWVAEQDVLHCHLTFASVMGTFVRFLRRLRRSRKPVVVETYHAVGMPIPKFQRWVHARLSSYRDALAVMAEDDYWNRFRALRPKLLSRLILNGVTAPRAVGAEESAAWRRAHGIPADVRLVGTIGALRPERHPERYVPMFIRISEQLGGGVHFVIGGDGPEMGRLQEAVARSGIRERIHLVGLVLEPALPLSALDLYLTLSMGTVTGIAALEAAHAGVPVLAMQFIDSYSPRETDWIWSSHDLVAIGDRAAALLADPPALAALAARQTAYALAHHTVDAMAASYYELYREAAEAVAAGR